MNKIKIENTIGLNLSTLDQILDPYSISNKLFSADELDQIRVVIDFLAADFMSSGKKFVSIEIDRDELFFAVERAKKQLINDEKQREKLKIKDKK